MAVFTGNKSTEGVTRKLYIGIGSSRVLGVNPTKAEFEKLRGFTPNEEPVYVTDTEVNGNTVKQVRLDFILKPNSSKYLDNSGNPVDVTVPATIFLRRMKRVSSEKGTIQIIDKYGRTAWASQADIDAHAIPQYANGPANIDPSYRVAYDGEEDLVNFIKAYLNLKNVEKWENNKVVGLIDNPAEAECLLDRMEDLFKGDFSEIKEILGYQPENELKAVYTVRTSDDGTQYQGVYAKGFMKNSVSRYAKITKEVMEAKERGSFATTDFDFDDLHEYSVTPTTFNTQAPSDAPVFNGSASPWQ